MVFGFAQPVRFCSGQDRTGCAILGVMTKNNDQSRRLSVDSSMSDTDLDYFEIAKKLTRAHSKALGDVYLKNTELGIASQVVRQLVDRLVYLAEMNHYGYHDQAESWTQCENLFCSDTLGVLESVGYRP